MFTYNFDASALSALLIILSIKIESSILFVLISNGTCTVFSMKSFRLEAAKSFVT